MALAIKAGKIINKREQLGCSLLTQEVLCEVHHAIVKTVVVDATV
jgi:hypothetical protein